MSRSRYKFQYNNTFFWKHNIGRYKFKYFNPWQRFFVFSKSSVILPCFVRAFVYVHKGHKFKYIYINRSMLGFRFGNFIITKKPFYFPIKVKKKK